MPSLFLWLASIIKKLEQRADKNFKKGEKKRKELKDKVLGRESEDISDEEARIQEKMDKSKKRSKVAGISAKGLALLGVLMAFFEGLIAFIAGLNWFIIMCCAIIVVVIVLAFLAFINSLLAIEDEALSTDDCEAPVVEGAIVSGGVLAWTEEELASRGTKLSDKEKNIYRIGILANKSIDGYGGAKLLNVKGVSTANRILMVIGISSIEDSMDYHTDKNILEYPTGRKANNGNASQSYGMMGLNVHRTLESYMGASVASKIKKQYSPKSSPSYPAQFAPYGVAMSAKHLTGDYNGSVNKASRVKAIQNIGKQWGIKANLAEYVGMTQLFITQAHYHGASHDEYEAYANFFAGMFALTSTNDAERTFDKWALVTKSGSKPTYDESGVRGLYIGNNTYGQLDNVATPSGLKTYKGSGSYIALNGKDIGMPLWKYVYENSKNKAGFNVAWKKAQSFSSIAGDSPSGWGKGARVLNFHYGVNSYLQAKKVESTLAGKMGIVGEAATKDELKEAEPEPTPTETTTAPDSGASCAEPEEKEAKDSDKDTDGNTDGVEVGSKQVETIIKASEDWLGTKYYLGNDSRLKLLEPGGHKNFKITKTAKWRGLGIDCSLLMVKSFQKAGINLPRTAQMQYNYSKMKNVSTKWDASQWKRGDLVFFSASHRSNGITHVGMYWGNGKIINSATSHGVSFIDVKTNPYWVKYYIATKRYSG